MRSGRGIKELAWAIAQSLHATDFTPVSMVLTYYTSAPTERIISLMMYDPQFDATREHYIRRMLAYGEFENGGLAMFSDLRAWVESDLLVISTPMWFSGFLRRSRPGSI
ncbi:MAG: hypothetical protein OSA97_09215 [Nevskia sp.]|nr:hypothetical protein [Nevskia sp.]